MALKVVKSAPTFTETGLDEIELLKCVSIVYPCSTFYSLLHRLNQSNTLLVHQPEPSLLGNIAFY